jgi:ABC-type phosphate/phosphonate transport system substrate-binding protein
VLVRAGERPGQPFRRDCEPLFHACLRDLPSPVSIAAVLTRLRLSLCSFVASVGIVTPGLVAQVSPRPTFIGVALDSGTRQADQRLTEYFYEKVGVAFTQDELEYEQVIRRLVNWRPEDGAFVARTTPYVYVVAEMLGAKVEPIATYVSATTNRTTYRSYFVVSRRSFSQPPDLSDVLRFLTQPGRRARFVYQSQFSTSSFFLPSLYFRANRIFQMPEPLPPLTALAADRIADASTLKLVDLVASGEADIAAVWDGVKAQVDSDPAAGQKVHFIPLPTAIPNDILVTSSGLEPSTKAKLQQAIGAMRPDEINRGDFLTWRNLNEVTDARLALGALRQAAQAEVAPVTVEIQLADNTTGIAEASALINAARQAVRLSETEFVLYDADFHGRFDFRWTLEPIHDGAVVLRSTLPGSDVDEQSFQLSFRDPEDLTARIVSVMQSRMHRIRYVWPYSVGRPSIIRDSAFALRAGTRVKVQRITWIDPQRNQFREGPVFESRIQDATFYRYELPVEDFTQNAAGVPFDPLSNVAFRVTLVRPAEWPWRFRLLTLALLGCFVAAAASAAWILFRHPSLRPSSSAASGS